MEQLVEKWRVWRNWAAGETVTGAVFAGPRLVGADRYYFYSCESEDGELLVSINRIKLSLTVVGKTNPARVAEESSSSEKGSVDDRCPAESEPVRGSPAGGSALLVSPASRGSWIADNNGGGRVRRGVSRGRIMLKKLYVSEGHSELSPDNLQDCSDDERLYWLAAERRRNRPRSMSHGANLKTARFVAPLNSAEEGDPPFAFRPPGRARVLPPPIPARLENYPRKGNVPSYLQVLPGKSISPRRRLVYEVGRAETDGAAGLADNVGGEERTGVDEVDGGRGAGQKDKKADGGEVKGAEGGRPDQVSEISEAAHQLSLSSRRATSLEGQRLGAIPKPPRSNVTFKLPSDHSNSDSSSAKRLKRVRAPTGGKDLVSPVRQAKRKDENRVTLVTIESACAWVDLSHQHPRWVGGVVDGIARTIADHSLLHKLLETMAWSAEQFREDPRKELCRVSAAFCSLVVTLQEAKECDPKLQAKDCVDISPKLQISLKLVRFEQAAVSRSAITGTTEPGNMKRPDLEFFTTEQGEYLYAIYLSLGDLKRSARVQCLLQGLHEAYVILLDKSEKLDWFGDSELQQRTCRAINGLETVMAIFTASPDAFSRLVFYYMMRSREDEVASVDDTLHVGDNDDGVEMEVSFAGPPARPIRSFPRQLDPVKNFTVLKTRLIAKIEEVGTVLSKVVLETGVAMDQVGGKLEYVDNRLKLLFAEENALFETLNSLREQRWV